MAVLPTAISKVYMHCLGVLLGVRLHVRSYHLISDFWRSVVAVGGKQLSQDVAESAGPPSDCPEDHQHYFTEEF